MPLPHCLVRSGEQKNASNFRCWRFLLSRLIGKPQDGFMRQMTQQPTHV